ncbi:T9SS type A sorting domain-containing protein [Myroides ceti]|uniref:T9SS type A sorting domain-containing protein n=1 Tax=Paenimyroides ceti TaxID=395087 RepID=A0ABT8CTJ1_9FLAO|nr:T9SS type A sorting domain-containing protein [Paenimyroides ceti]MDN3706943.1 T9SS type A sorting domain-containing protein [Paenimyroides ceti]MDN3709062.1 T9SS type A sorting domain-containing protein [Paenimyroides ceti]
MKNFISIMAVVGLFLQSLSLQAQTQEEELKNNEWYVHKVIYNDIEYIAPVNDERSGSVPNLKFFENSSEGFFVIIFCFIRTSNNLLFLENQQFSSIGWISPGVSPSACIVQENNDYYFYYFSVMNVFDATITPYFYSYEVNSIDSTTKQLIITNQNGDKAYFYTSYLSNPIFELEGINIYPNPVSDVVQIDLLDTTKERYDYKIYDSNGKLIKVFKDKKGPHITLEIQDLASGIYWLEINTPDAQQRGYSTKIIKK